MPQSTFEKFLPASGILAGILFALGGYLAKLPESTTDNPVAVITGHETQNMVSFIATALFAVTFAFFTVGIRQALRSGEPGESTYSSAAFAGGIIVATVSALSAWITLSLMDVVDDKDVVTAKAISALGIGSWVPLMVGLAVLLLSTGLGGLRTAVLPKWLAIVTIVLGVCCLLGPTGFAVWFAMPLWCIAVSVVLVRRQSVDASSAPLREPATA